MAGLGWRLFVGTRAACSAVAMLGMGAAMSRVALGCEQKWALTDGHIAERARRRRGASLNGLNGAPRPGSFEPQGHR
eukprot:13736777-Alexandrium_andersonii.AAC.2